MLTTIRLDKWDVRFMELAKLVASWSKDPSTQTGAVLVSPDKTDVILGYNGFPKRMPDTPELYADREVKYSRIVHCEMNAVLLSKRSVAGYTLYTHPFLSCDRCATHMVQAGIARVVAPKADGPAGVRWEPTFIKSRQYFTEAGVQICEYHPITLEYAPNFFRNS